MKASFRFCCSLAVAAAAMGALGYDDSYISADDESVVKKEVDGRVVYVFSTAGAAASVTLKQTMTLEEALVVGGGGAGGYALSSSTDGGASGGGGGGFVHTNLCALLTEGSTLALRVGGGGDPLENYEAEARPEPTGGNGGESSLSIGKIKIVAYGGGGGAGAHENLPGSGKVASSGGFRAPSTLRFDYADDGEGVYFTSSQGGRAGYVPGYGFAAAGGLGGGGASGRLTRQYDRGQSDGAEGRTCWITGEREVYGSGGGGGCGHVFAPSGGLGGTHAGSGKQLASGRKADGDVGFGGGGGGSSSRVFGAGGAGGSGTVVLSFSVVNTTAKSFSVEVPTMYPYDAEGSACPFPVVRMGQETLVKDVDYELNYQDNAKGSLSRGWAWVKVVGKEGSPISGLVKSVPFLAVKAYLVDPAATEAAAGDTWATATTLEDAYSRAAADEEIWLKVGTFVRTANLAVDKQLVFRGGFAADDVTNLAKRSVGSRTVLDGNDALSTLITLNPSANIIDEVLFERIGFRRTTASSFYSTGKQAFVCRFSDCAFSEAILNASSGGGSGAAVNIRGDTYSSVQEVVFEDCSFTGNGRPPASAVANGSKYYGATIAVAKQTRLRLERCLFKDNGWPTGVDGSKYSNSEDYRGSCIYATGDGNDASKVVAVRAFDCRFIGNRINVEARVYGQHGGTVVLASRISGDTLFKNCLFAANESTCLSGSSSRDGYGMLYLSATDVNQSTVTVDRCTFAYNLQNAKSSAAGLTVVKGRAFVTDSIFFGNMVGKSDTEAADLQVRTDGYVQVKRSLFAAEAETGSGYVNAAVPANLVMEDIVWGDPRFVTSKETFLSALSTKPDGCTPTLPKTADATVRYDDEKRVQAATFDYHLLSKGGYYTNDGVWHDGSNIQSPAVWRNGREIVNLGAYAGTGEQSLPQKDGLMILLR